MKKKKSLKGMTLFEIIIALAVFGMMGLVLVTIGATVDNMTKATTGLKSKISVQSPYAANQKIVYGKNVDGTDKTLTENDITIDVKVGGVSGWYFKIDPSDPTKLICESDGVTPKKFYYTNPEQTLDANQYNTEEIILDEKTDGMTPAEKAAYQAEYEESVNGNLNFKFITIEP